MAVQIQGGSSTAGKANVDAGYNLNVALPTDETYAGFAAIVSENDSGLVGTRYLVSPETTEDYRLRVGVDTQQYALSFEGTIIPQGHIQQNLTSFTATQGSGFLTLNAGNSVTIAQGANIRTYRTFPIFGTFPCYSEFWLAVGNPTSTGTVTEWGFGYVSGVTVTPSDGVYFRLASGGALTAVANFAGVELPTSAISTAAIPNRDGTAAPLDFTKAQHYVVNIHHDECEFWINDVRVATIRTPGSQPFPTSAMNQPIFVRTYNSAGASAARQAKIGYLGASTGDMNSGKPYPHVIAGSGGGGYQIQPGTASGQTTTYANGAAPGAGVWTASTAPATNSLGGLWLSPAALATGAESDFPLFAYLNPVGTATLPGKTLYVTGVRVGETWVTATLGTVGTILTWAVACGSTASSLATTDAAATVGPRRVALGAQSFAAAAAVGTLVAGLPQITFTTPLVVPPGCYFHVIVRNLLNGTAAGQLRGSVMVDAYFE